MTNVLAVHQAYDREAAWELWDKINDNIGFYVRLYFQHVYARRSWRVSDRDRSQSACV